MAVKLKEIEVPDTMHELLQLALNDLKKVEEKDDRYRINMDVWHTPEVDGKCEVCLAGCVLAQSFEFPPSNHFTSTAWEQAISYDWNEALDCLDTIRCGDLPYAVSTFYDDPIDMDIKDFPIINYEVNPKLFKEQIQEVIDYLKEHNL